jgi:cytosine/adenosine deaminase-related metal-dependent hydrolase
MPTDSKSWSVQASWGIPGDGRIIRQGVLRGRGETIEAVGPADEVAPASSHRTLQNVAILPGLVNAHAHLELSHLRGLLPRRASMPRWLMSLLRHRGTDEQQLQAVAAGAHEAIATGTTAIADVSHNNGAWRVLKDLPIRKLCLAEVLGVGPLESGAMDRLARSLEGLPPPDDRLRFGISPHAPYSTSEKVYREAIALARERGWPVCTHLAETKGERQFLMRGGGTFARFLQNVRLLDPSFTPPACKPLEFARRVGLLGKRGHSTFPPLKEIPNNDPALPINKDESSQLTGKVECPLLLAHVNYMDDEEMEILAASRASVVYCPGSSAFFGRTGHRYADMLAAGVNVAIGTDSLASNDSLDMLAEMRRLKRQGRVDNHTILRMATLNGAIAMGWQDMIGTLEPGKAADWIAVEVGKRDSGFRVCETRMGGIREDVLENILTHRCKVVETVIGGQTVFRAKD